MNVLFNSAAVISIAAIVTGLTVMVANSVTSQRRHRRTYEMAQRFLSQPVHRDAWKTAERLLLSRLNSAQKRDYRTKQRFGVIGSNGGCYIVRCEPGRVNFNVIQIHPGGGQICTLKEGLCSVAEYCARPKPISGQLLPLPDIWLAQMLELRCREPDFLRIAAKHDTSMRVRELVYERR